MQKKVLKISSIILALLLIIFLFVPLFLPSTLIVRAQTTSQADVKLLFRQVNILRNWARWNPFEKEDPEMISTYQGPPMGKGAIHRWESSKLGNGMMRIANSRPYSSIQCELDFDKSGNALNTWQFESLLNSSGIHWEIEIYDLSYPFGRIAGLFLPGILKPMMQQGLENINNIVAHQSDPVEVMEIEVPPMACIYIEDTAMQNELRSRMQQTFDQLFHYAHLSGIGISGHPFAMFPHKKADNIISFHAAIPVWEEVRESSPIRYAEYPGMNALMATRYGTHKNLEKLHEDIFLFLTENAFITKGHPIEQYIKGPHNEPDTTKWITEVIYGIE